MLIRLEPTFCLPRRPGALAILLLAQMPKDAMLPSTFTFPGTRSALHNVLEYAPNLCVELAVVKLAVISCAIALEMERIAWLRLMKTRVVHLPVLCGGQRVVRVEALKVSVHGNEAWYGLFGKDGRDSTSIT